MLSRARYQRPPGAGFRHEAWLYDGADDFVSGAADFVRGGLARGEGVMVATIPANLRGLRPALGVDASRVELVDMSDLGRNPGRILPVWRQFARDEAAAGRRARGIGEPVWAGRAPEELDECRRHEALINSALHGADSDFWLLCPYDRSALDRATLDAVEWTHPRLYEGRRGRASHGFRPTLGDAAFDGDLDLPPPHARLFRIDEGGLSDLRAFVRTASAGSGLGPRRVGDLCVIATELATNSLLHAGGGATVAMWTSPGAVHCEVDDAGRMDDPLVGRLNPHPQQTRGRGVWIVHQLADLVRIRSSRAGTRVRATMRLPAPPV
jgi:anti-sigma regulatory factor (Ser/Thr protein kinase)